MNNTERSDYKEFDSRTYDEQALQYLNPLRPDQISKRVADANHGVLGITGEVGELADVIKKAFVNNLEIDRQKVIDECGDILWFVALTLRAVDSNTSEAMQANVSKIQARYGERFSEIRYNRENRNRDKEEKAISSVVTGSGGNSL